MEKAKKLRVRKRDVVEFCELLGLLLSSEVPILDTFDTLAKHFHEKIRLRRAILHIKQGVVEGQSMAKPMREVGFTEALCSTVEACEAGGMLDIGLAGYASLLKEPKHSDEKTFFLFLSFFIGLGLNTQRSLELTAEHFGNAFYKRIMRVVEHIENRHSLDRALKLEGFDVVVCCLVKSSRTNEALSSALNSYARLIG